MDHVQCKLLLKLYIISWYVIGHSAAWYSPINGHIAAAVIAHTHQCTTHPTHIWPRHEPPYTHILFAFSFIISMSAKSYNNSVCNVLKFSLTD